MSRAQGSDIRLDLLRALALACIILAHVYPPPLIMKLRDFDVVLIVMVAGASFSLSSPSAALDYGSYVLKRLERLLWPCWIFLSLLFSLEAIFCQPFNPAPMLRSYLLLDGIGYVWILRVFLGVALAAPLLRNLSERSGTTAKFLALLLLIEMACLGFSSATAGLEDSPLKAFLGFAVFDIVPYACVFGVGMSLFRLKRNEIAGLALAVLAAFVGLAWHYGQTQGFPSTAGFKYPPQPFYLAYGLGASLALYALCYSFSSLGPFGKPITWFSRATLWVYLWHILFLPPWCWVPNSTGHGMLRFAAVTGLAVLATLLQAAAVKALIAHSSWAAQHRAWLFKVFCP